MRKMLWAYGFLGALGWIAVGVLLFGGGCAALGQESLSLGEAMGSPVANRQPGVVGDSGHQLYASGGGPSQAPSCGSRFDSGPLALDIPQQQLPCFSGRFAAPRTRLVGAADGKRSGPDGDQTVSRGAGIGSAPLVWRASLAALAVGHALDIASSMPSPNTYEGNRFMRGHDGDLSIGRAVAYKSAAMGAFAIGQYVLVRRYPKAARWLAAVNFGHGALAGRQAARNWRLR